MPTSIARIAVIGKNNHAARHIRLLQSCPGVELAAVYYPWKTEDDGLPVTAKFTDVTVCDAVIISSPTPTHAEYLERLKDYQGYVLVEKPAVSTVMERQTIKAWNIDRKSRTKVNFNLQYSPLVKLLASIIKDKRMGKLIALDIHTGHGLAFKNEYNGSWRNRHNDSGGVLETVGIHYVQLVLSLFGAIKYSEADLFWVADCPGSPDTAVLRMRMLNGIQVTLRHSYATPLINRWFLLGSDGYWEYDGLAARFFSPRDTFDASGRFVSPPMIDQTRIEYSNLWQESLRLAIADFIHTVRAKHRFDPSEFDLAVDSIIPIDNGLQQIKASV